jgi:hypothetical protein
VKNLPYARTTTPGSAPGAGPGLGSTSLAS